MPTWTQADVDTLAKAVASGVLSVTYDGPPRRSVTYQSLDSMRALLAAMRRSASGSPSARLVTTRKGFRGNNGGGGWGNTPWGGGGWGGWW